MTVQQLKARLREDLKLAMRARESGAVALLRTLAAAIDNAEAVPLEANVGHADPGAAAGKPSEVDRHVLSRDEIAELLERERSERLEAAQEYDALGKAPEASRLRAEAALIARYQ